jgi:hypothetical protein
MARKRDQERDYVCKAPPYYAAIQCQQAYDRQVVEGVGEYLQASQQEWDIFIEEDFRARIENIREWLGDGVIADYDDPEIERLLADVEVPIVGVGGSYHRPECYPPVHYIATDNAALVSAFHLKKRASSASPFTGCPLPAVNAGLSSANTRFASWSRRRNIAAWSIRAGDRRKTGSTRKRLSRTGCKRSPRKPASSP